MIRNATSRQSQSQVLITRKLRDRLAAGSFNGVLTDTLSRAPVKQGHLSIDLSNTNVRHALSLALQPFLKRDLDVPPALVGSARRVDHAITRYEQRTSNYDLFDDL